MKPQNWNFWWGICYWLCFYAHQPMLTCIISIRFLFVHLSAISWYFVETVANIKLFSLCHRPIISSFLSTKHCYNFQWHHPQRGQHIIPVGYQKTANVDQHVGISQKQYKTRPQLLRIDNREIWLCYQTVISDDNQWPSKVVLHCVHPAINTYITKIMKRISGNGSKRKNTRKQ